MCATVALCAVCARGAVPWTWPPSVARYCGMLWAVQQPAGKARQWVAGAARRGCGRGGGGARLRHSAAAAETEGRQWRRRQVAEEGRWSSEVAAAARGVGVRVWVCVPPWPSAQCAPAAPFLGHGLRASPGTVVCYGLCSSQQVKPGSGWQEQQGAAAAEVAAGRGCGTARLRQRPKAGSGVGGKWQKKVGGAARWRQRHVGWG